MATVYIAPTAQGSADGTSAANAYAYSSLSSAETDAGSGGTILFTDGTYPQTSLIYWDADGVTYKALNQGEAVIDGTVSSQGDYTQQLRVGNTGVSVILDGFHFIDQKFLVSGTSVFVKNSKFTNSTYIRLYNNGYFSGGASTIKYHDCLFHLKINQGTLIFNSDTSAHQFEGCTLFVDFSSNVTNTLGNSAINLAKNMIFSSSDGTKLTGDLSSYATNCCFYEYVATSGGTNNVFADPLFVDSANGDLRLRPSSPCINAGTAS